MDTISDFLANHRDAIWLLVYVTPLLSLVVAPWLVGRWRRKRNLPPIRVPRRVFGCLAIGMLGALVLCLPGFGYGVFPYIVGLPALALLLTFLGKPRFFPRGLALFMLTVCSLAILVLVGTFLGSWGQHFRRLMDQSTLYTVRTGLLMYEHEYDVYPDDLRRLVDKGCTDPGLLVFGIYRMKQKPEFPTTRPYAGPCDVMYNRLPPDAPKDLVWLYYPPSFYQGEGTWVIYSDGTQREEGPFDWVTPDQLRQDLARTQEWMKSHPYPTTAPATMPARVPHFGRFP